MGISYVAIAVIPPTDYVTFLVTLDEVPVLRPDNNKGYALMSLQHRNSCYATIMSGKTLPRIIQCGSKFQFYHAIWPSSTHFLAGILIVVFQTIALRHGTIPDGHLFLVCTTIPYVNTSSRQFKRWKRHTLLRFVLVSR